MVYFMLDNQNPDANILSGFITGGDASNENRPGDYITTSPRALYI